MKERAIYLLKVFLLLYVILVGFLYFAQRNLLYHPLSDMLLPQEYGLAVQKISLQTRDGLALTAWYRPPKDGHKYTLLYAHGNAGNLGSRANKFKVFTEHGLGLMGVSYRGYGTSEGKPSEQGLYNDMRSAMDYLKEIGTPEKNIIMYGESLGTGVAVQMATEYDFKVLILEAPFTSVVDRAQELYPFAPAWLLVKDRFDSISKIKDISEPVIIIHGDNDAVIPINHGQSLFREANMPKHFVLLSGRGHNNIPAKTIVRELHSFIQQTSQK